MVNLTPAELATLLIISAATGFLIRYGIALWKSRDDAKQFKLGNKPLRWDG